MIAVVTLTMAQATHSWRNIAIILVDPVSQAASPE
jgi:hypothetical protein